jgi:hypothetical protein
MSKFFTDSGFLSKWEEKLNKYRMICFGMERVAAGKEVVGLYLYRGEIVKLSKFILIVFSVVVLASTAQGSSYGGSGCSGGGSGIPDNIICADPITLTDWTYFNDKYTSDTQGSTASNGDLLFPDGYGGDFANILSNDHDFVSWSHNFTFNPAVMPGGIVDAWLTLSLTDFEIDLGRKDENDHDDDDVYNDHDKDKDGHDRAKKESKVHKVKFEFRCDTSIDSNTSNESAKLFLEGSNSITINDVDTGLKKFDVVLTALYDGKFDIRLESTLNDFQIDWSRLDIEYCPELPSPVPEPGTLMLFGAGFIGVALFRRKK